MFRLYVDEGLRYRVYVLYSTHSEEYEDGCVRLFTTTLVL